MFLAPICSTSAYSLTQKTSRESITSVTMGRPVSSLAFFRIWRPFRPNPWNAYGELRGLKAPPRRAWAPAFFTAIAVSMVCSSLSTVHGPAMHGEPLADSQRIDGDNGPLAPIQRGQFQIRHTSSS